ncbi:hypothetical protein IJ732_02700 [bacterium]|nr:hypothetical protein [bacterium]
MKEFDLYISLGAFCSCTQSLRKSGLQFFSYPYDWMAGGDFYTRVKILTNNFENWFNKEDLEYFGTRKYPEPRDIYINQKTGIIYNHDFSLCSSLDLEYDKVKEKFNRRIKRLISQIENANTVLFVYIENPDTKNHISNSEIIENYEILKNRFKNTCINILFLAQADDISYQNRKETLINKYVTKIEFDYSRHNPKNLEEVNLYQSLKVFNDYKISDKYLIPKNKIEIIKIKIVKMLNLIINIDNVFTKNNKYKEITILGFNFKIKIR